SACGAGSAQCGAAGRDRIARRARRRGSHRGGDVVGNPWPWCRDCRRNEVHRSGRARERELSL
ncbi:hypothetical protein C3R29_12785, partial [Mycobacterium tuberculosis]